MNDILDAGKRRVYSLIYDNYRVNINIMVDSNGVLHGFQMEGIEDEKTEELILQTTELYSEHGEQQKRIIDGSWLLNKIIWYCHFIGPFEAEVYVSFYLDENRKEKSLIEKLQDLEDSRNNSAND